MVPILRLTDICAPAARVHLARASFLPGRGTGLHTHDFAELFWVDSGAGAHELNGTETQLETGDVVLIRPADVHGYPPGTESMTITNIAFPEPALTALAERYFRGDMRFWGGPQRAPVRPRPTAGTLAQLRAGAAALAAHTESELALDCFLLTLLQLTGCDDTGNGPPPPLPDWLHDACARIREPQHFRRGVRGFVRLAGRCPEHVARTTSRCLGRRPSAIVEAARMAHAAQQLAMTDAPIEDVAADVGLRSLAAFYHSFQRVHGIPPGRYRRRHRRGVVSR
jgi:AraC family cel operon transcriptional repressor